MPELITVCWANGKPYQAIYAVQGEMEIFNPSVPRVYTVMDTILREVKRRFPSNYIHLGIRLNLFARAESFLSVCRLLLGMDEVYDKCW